MNAFRRLPFTVVASALLMLTFALAQAPTDATTTQAADAASGSASLHSLRLQAHRLAFLNALPEASRAEATALLERADELRSRARDLRRTTLEAYVAALEQGDDRTVARAAADAAVSDVRLTLSQDQARLRADANTFLSAHPELDGALGTAFGRRFDMDPSMDLGMGMGRRKDGRVGPMADRSGGGMTFGRHHPRGRSQNAPYDMKRGMGRGEPQHGRHPRSGTSTDQVPGAGR